MSTKQSNTFRNTAVLAGFLIMNLPTLATALLLRNLGWLIGRFVESEPGDKFDFARIFAQIRDARLTMHWILPALLGVVFFAVAFRCFATIGNRAVRRALSVTLFLVLLILALAASLALTRVNGIRFCDLLGKLLPLIDKL